MTDREMRCTTRKHLADRGETFCDCGALMLGMTAAKNARIVTILDDVQRVNASLMTSATRALPAPDSDSGPVGVGEEPT